MPSIKINAVTRAPDLFVKMVLIHLKNSPKGQEPPVFQSHKIPIPLSPLNIVHDCRPHIFHHGPSSCFTVTVVVIKIPFSLSPSLPPPRIDSFDAERCTFMSPSSHSPIET